jgi:hypothetical protein
MILMAATLDAMKTYGRIRLLVLLRSDAWLMALGLRASHFEHCTNFLLCLAVKYNQHTGLITSPRRLA